MFTKYDQFLRNIKMHLADYPDQSPDNNVFEVAEKQFKGFYLQPLGDNIRYVRLESGFEAISRGHILMFSGRNACPKSALQ